ncbi:hypothetical protein McanMca71_001366 [Microsporum canis]|uniref:Uncharacterized protein n=1 Tax=Arthroderma otae (strain ATCC MYA-4605 / CBS 113480) TaxID=554155 RepID=C5FTY7_ARTOC|nr:conserved hypothetical protein [Microsporum canis CBS 113480]EEQ33371.1 conserved hypothetical protein [Microsporum canis CBS 113480]
MKRSFFCSRLSLCQQIFSHATFSIEKHPRLIPRSYSITISTTPQPKQYPNTNTQLYPKSHQDVCQPAQKYTKKRYGSISGEKSSNSAAPDGLVESPIILRRSEKRASLNRIAKTGERSKHWDQDSSLVRNPWAIALASPPRLCHATHSRLPTELMIDFGLVQHPETSALWLLPTSLLEDELREATGDAGSRVTTEHDSPPADDGNPAVGADNTSKPRKEFPLVRVTNSGTLLNMLSNPKYSNISKGLVPPSWKQPQGPLSKNAMQTLVWRGDMANHVLQAMRRQVLRSLKKILQVTPKTKKQQRQDTWTVLNNTEYPITQGALEDSLQQLPELRDIRSGVVLILRPDHLAESNLDHNGDSDFTTSTATDKQSFDLVELPVQRSQVPVFDLTKLLSLEELQAVRQLGEVFQGGALYFIPATRKSALFVLDLWRLKSFFMERSEGEEYPASRQLA